MLQHHGLAGLGRGDQQAALAFADGCDDVDDASGDVLFGADVALQRHVLGREQRRQVLEQDLVLGVLRRLTVDLVHLDQRHITLALFRGAYLALDRIAGMQVETAHLAGADVDVIRSRQVGSIRRAQETEAVRQHFQGAFAENAFAFFRMAFQQRKHQVLLAHAVGIVDLIGGCHFHQFGDVFGLEVG